jgi:hypothetical protein
MENKKTLMEMLLDAGYPRAEMYNHYSDLYVYVTDITTKVINEWAKENGFNVEHHCPKFKCQITGRMMYDCAFQFYSSIK